jgi:hypothetical protein
MRNKEALQLDGEQWKPIPDYPLYEVSNIGRVKTLHYGNAVIRRQSNRISYNRLYKGITLISQDGKHKGFFVHRLVALAFIPNPLGLSVVHHIDNNASNNRVENLRWTTQKENINEAIKIHGKWLSGVNNGKAVFMGDPKTKEVMRFDSIRKASNHLAELIKAKGGTPSPNMSGNICHACVSHREAYGFSWAHRKADLFKPAIYIRRKVRGKYPQSRRSVFYPATGKKPKSLDFTLPEL